jgi:hypothetical protein
MSQSCFSLPNPYQELLEDLKAIGVTSASFIRDAVTYQIQQEALLDEALALHPFTEYYLEDL